MTIKESNYELYALEYLEGTLSPALQQKMELFLERNPVVKEELEAMRELVVVVPDETIFFTKKSNLLKKEPQRLVVWKRPWQLGIAASIALLVGFMTIYQVQQLEERNKELLVQVPSIQMEDKQAKSDIIEVPSKEVATQTPNSQISQVAINATQVMVDQKTKSRKKEVFKKDFKTTVLKRQIIANKNTLAKTTISSQNIANQSQRLHLNTLGNHKQELASSMKKDHTNSIITRQQEVAVTNPAQLIVPNIEMVRIAALPSLPLKPLATKEVGINPAMEDMINQSLEEGLIAYTNPKKRTLKSFVGKLPGNGIGISILPSFFTE